MQQGCQHIENSNIKPPTSSQHVYKDECCHCFYSQDSQHGIDVCLSCFQAGCLAPGRQHAVGHYSHCPTHHVVLNIQRHERSKPTKSENPSLPTKLAVVAETDADKYEYITKVKCLACSIDIESTNTIVSPVVEGVMKALSSAQQSEVKAWEQEMIACEHTLTLQQEPSRTLEDQALATCSSCDLKENLWLCLVCGTLSCGRKQFGGGGGNGHGLEHVDSTGHGLAVKLGSITPEGTADIYCYTCDEERLDPMLQEHLAHWGIKLADRTKTERSLQEMQIEQNMKWEFSMTSENGKEMVPLFGAGFTGMKNIGNSCYLASVVQSLMALPQFRARFFLPFTENSDKIVPDAPNDLETQMRKLADGLLSGDFSKPRRSPDEDQEHQLGISPSMLKALIGRGHAEFGTMRQQDAFEFLLYLIEKLDKLVCPTGLTNPTSSFDFQVEQRTQCLGCQKVAYRVTKQDNISVLVPARKSKTDTDGSAQYESVTLLELFDIFTAEEQVQYTCSSCSSSAGASKRTLFRTFPETLVLNPGRFALENWVPQKLEIAVDIPNEGFTLDKYLSQGQQADEDLLPDDSVSMQAEPMANESDMEQLMAMGFPKVRAEKALLITKAGAETAMEWLFAHMEDADIDEPYRVPSAGGADASIVSSLVDMGFPEPRCQKAALATGNSSTEAAMDWVMQHMDDPDIDTVVSSGAAQEENSSEAGSATLPAHYTAKAMACHKGSSIHAGHYVAFIKKEIDGQSDWVLYNDEKVLRGVDWQEASRTAYVYFFQRT